MLNTYSFNPQILPSNSGKPADHHKVITGAVIAAVAMIIIGGLYWWVSQGRVEDVPVPTNVDGRITLTPAEIQAKEEMLRNIAEINSKRVQLSPEEIKKKEALLKEIQQGQR